MNQSNEQIYTRPNSNGQTVYLKLPNAKEMIIGYLSGDTFQTVKKTSKNVMRMYNNGIGINAKLFAEYNFRFIEMNFNGDILRTTKNHFLKHSITSKYVSDKVDQQLILPLAKWFIPLELARPQQATPDLNLFSSVG